MKVWTAAEAQRFLATAGSARLGALYDLDLNTGLRRGELVALRRADLDLECLSLAVRRSTTTVAYVAVDDTHRGQASARTIDLDEDTVRMLRAHRRRQLEERMAWDEHGSTRALCSPARTGQRCTRRRRSGTSAGSRGWPAFRRSDCTICGTHTRPSVLPVVPPKVMHERPATHRCRSRSTPTSHVAPGMQADAAAVIGRLLRGVSA